jgi:hypothetical protein
LAAGEVAREVEVVATGVVMLLAVVLAQQLHGLVEV